MSVAGRGLAGCIAALAVATASADPGTVEDRRALFRYLLDKTSAREAFSPVKNRRLGIDFEKDAAPLEGAFVDAGTDIELFRAILRLSNCRKDFHLTVEPVEGGLDVEVRTLEAPLGFRPDYSDPDSAVFFVAEVAEGFERFSEVTPGIGDVVVSVNGIPTKRYLEMTDPYMRYSTRNRKLWAFAKFLGWKRNTFGPELYGKGEGVRYVLRRADGEEYELELPYLDADDLEWNDAGPRRFPGFREELAAKTFTFYRRVDDEPVVLIVWHGFGAFMRAELTGLMRHAVAEGLLDHDVIVDATHSRGGQKSPELVQRLTSRRFKTTFSDLRISDVLPELIERRERKAPDSRRLRWFRTAVAAAAARGDEYSPAVPFRLGYLPPDSDGYLQPALPRFRGNLACLFFPMWGSSLDQFAAMIVDNDLGHTIGMPPAGHSNAWEWEETLTFASSGRPVVRYMWSIGRTIRPNGEFLEGNPAVPAETVPMTRENYPDYFDMLLRRALDHLREARAKGAPDREEPSGEGGSASPDEDPAGE